MRPKSTATAILIVLAAAGFAAAQTAPYIAQFPSVDQVKEHVRGSDELDTAARRMGVFWQMKRLIYNLAYSQGRTDRQFTPDELRLAGEYNAAYSGTLAQMDAKVPPADKQTWLKLHTGYVYDRDLRDEVFRKFFTPQLRQAVYVALKEQPPSGPPTSAPASAAGTSTDASIQKARAAKVDTTVAGMRLGEPLSLPPCPMISLEPPSRNCDMGNTAQPVQLFGVTLASNKDADPEIWRVRLAEANHPDWAAPDPYVRIHNGVLVGVYILTKGRGVERSVNAELKAKYGTPIGFYTGTITPTVGNVFEYRNPEWVLPGLHVEYEVLMRYPNENRVDMENGIVRIETTEAHQRRVTKSKAPPKRKL